MKYKVYELAEAGRSMFQIVNIKLSVGLSAEKREAIFPGNGASRRV